MERERRGMEESEKERRAKDGLKRKGRDGEVRQIGKIMRRNKRNGRD